MEVEAPELGDELVRQEVERSRWRTAVRSARTDFEDAERMLATTVREARRAGVTWRQLGECLGTSPQGAQKRYRTP
jgi:hypothetical protein